MFLYVYIWHHQRLEYTITRQWRILVPYSGYARRWELTSHAVARPDSTAPPTNPALPLHASPD